MQVAAIAILEMRTQLARDRTLQRIVVTCKHYCIARINRSVDCIFMDQSKYRSSCGSVIMSIFEHYAAGIVMPYALFLISAVTVVFCPLFSK